MPEYSERAIDLAELVLERITSVRRGNCQAVETRIHPADYDEITAGKLSLKHSPNLWGLPLKADAKVPVGSPRVLAKATSDR